MQAEVLTSKGAVSIGSVVPRITVRDSQDGTELLDYAVSSGTILYVFSPACAWCIRNVAAVQALATQTAARYRFVGLSLSDVGLSQFLVLNKPAFPVLQPRSLAELSAYHPGMTPETLVISKQRIVLADWRGAYTNATKDSIEEFFSVNLPQIN
jgi:hypothetical protein